MALLLVSLIQKSPNTVRGCTWAQSRVARSHSWWELRGQDSKHIGNMKTGRRRFKRSSRSISLKRHEPFPGFILMISAMGENIRTCLHITAAKSVWRRETASENSTYVIHKIRHSHANFDDKIDRYLILSILMKTGPNLSEKILHAGIAFRGSSR